MPGTDALGCQATRHPVVLLLVLVNSAACRSSKQRAAWPGTCHCTTSNTDLLPFATLSFLLLPCSKVMTADEVAESVVGMLDELRIERACVMAHSYGRGHASVYSELSLL
jgi:hypothetical protein